MNKVVKEELEMKQKMLNNYEENLSEVNEKNRSIVSHLEFLLSAQKAETERISNALKVSELEINSKNAVISNLEEQLVDSLKSHSLKDSEVAQLNLKLENAFAEINQSSKRIHIFNLIILDENYSFQKMMVETQLKAKSEAVTDLQNELDTTKTHLSDALSELNNLMALKDNLKSELKSLDDQFRSSTSELIESESKLETIISDLKQQCMFALFILSYKRSIYQIR